MCAGDISEAPYSAATAGPEGPPDRSPPAYPASGSRGHARGISRRQVLAGLAGAPSASAATPAVSANAVPATQCLSIVLNSLVNSWIGKPRVIGLQERARYPP